MEWNVISASSNTRDGDARPPSNRYVGEIVSEAEAEMRQNDAYLFSLDDKVKGGPWVTDLLLTALCAGIFQIRNCLFVAD